MCETNISPKKMIPMRELKKLTNLTRATINFYIKEGILPAPQKTAKNMAYYDEDFIKNLRLIETMKKENYSLNQIKKLITSEAGTINDFCAQILESVNKLLPYSLNDAAVSIAQIGEIGLTEKAIAELIHMKIIIPIDNAHTMFPAYSITVCKLIKYFIDSGIPLTIAEDIIMKIKDLAYFEKNAFVEYIRGPMIESNISPDNQKAAVENCIQSINALLPILHLQFLKLPTESMLKTTNE